MFLRLPYPDMKIKKTSIVFSRRKKNRVSPVRPGTQIAVFIVLYSEIIGGMPEEIITIQTIYERDGHQPKRFTTRRNASPYTFVVRVIRSRSGCGHRTHVLLRSSAEHLNSASVNLSLRRSVGAGGGEGDEATRAFPSPLPRF